MSDPLMSLYLLGLGTADLWYYGRYITVAETWKTSPVCQILRIVSSLSAEVSLFNVVLLSGFFLLTSRSTSRFHTWKKKIIGTCVISWILFGFMSCLHIFLLSEMTSGTCLFLNLGSSMHRGWQLISLYYLAMNTVFIFMSVYFSIMLVHLKYTTAKAVQQSGQITGSSRGYLAFGEEFVGLCPDKPSLLDSHRSVTDNVHVWSGCQCYSNQLVYNIGCTT